MDLEDKRHLYDIMKQVIHAKFCNNYRKMHGKPLRRYVQLRKVNRHRWREVTVLKPHTGHVISNGKEIMFVD